jgi:rsbT co-antagonist protein RsbR
MDMDDDTQLTTVSAERLRRIVDVLSLVSLGEFDPAKTTIDIEGKTDAFARVEASLNVMTSELAEARVANDEYVARLQTSRRDLEEKLETIERQRHTIRDLSTPIIELWDDILTLPIVGIVDTQRSLEMTTRLLRRLAESRYRCVIIDVTGVDVVDTMTADHFVKMIKSAQLLGVYSVITGVSPDIAQTLVRIGVELGPVKTLRSLKEGLKDCFLYLRRKDQEEDAEMLPRGR